MKNKVKGFYGIIDFNLLELSNVLNITKTYLSAGVKIIELKMVGVTSDIFYKTAVEIKELQKEFNFTFLIYGRIDIVKMVDADGVHLDYNHLSIDVVREYLNDKIIGVACYNAECVYDMQTKGADFVTLGPFFHSDSIHLKNYNLLSIDVLKEVVKDIHIPIVAFGGINLVNVKDIIETKVNSISLASDILKDSNPYLKVKTFVSLFEGFYNKKNILIINKDEFISQKAVEFIHDKYENTVLCDIVTNIEEAESKYYKVVIYAINSDNIECFTEFNVICDKINCKFNEIVVLSDVASLEFRNKTKSGKCLAILDVNDENQFNILNLILESVIKKD